jgi:hypothetical protein
MKSRKERRRASPTDPKKGKGTEMCEIGADGRPTNGRIMLELLGDEPDVSHTSLALARKLGLSKQVLKMLGEGRDIDPSRAPHDTKNDD